MLKFSPANAKLVRLYQVPTLRRFLADKRKVYSLNLLSGWSCPYAKECLSKVHIRNGKRKIKDGPHTKFRCFSASEEAVFPNVYNLRKHNFDLLKMAKGISGKFDLIVRSIPHNLGICRIHAAGDFFNQDYFDAWVKVAEQYPDRLFYAYTKSLPFYLRYEYVTDNFVLTASRGGRKDNLIDQYGLREAIVVFDENTSYTIDHDDSHAADPDKKEESFALLLHGEQPAKSDAAKAFRQLRGRSSYSRKKV